MRPYNVHEAKTHLSALLDRVEAGEEIVLARSGRPIARLVPLARPRAPRVLGLYAGQPFVIAEDFGTLPADLAAAFEGAASEGAASEGAAGPEASGSPPPTGPRGP